VTVALGRLLFLFFLAAGALAPAVAYAQEEGEALFEEAAPPLVDASAAARWVWYLGIFVIVGGCAFRLIARRSVARARPGLATLVPGIDRGARRLALAGAGLVTLAQLVRLWLQARGFTEPGEPLTTETLGLVLSVSWGTGWLAQIAATALALAGLLAAGRMPRAGWTAAMLGAVALAATAPLTGHAMASPWPASVAWPLQALHVLGGALWLGSLAGLLALGFRGTRGLATPERTEAIAVLVRGFSPFALLGAGTAVLLGAALTYGYVGDVGTLISTVYGRTLVLKVLLLGLVAGLGAYNWRRITPGLDDPAQGARLGRSATTEIVAGALLLAITAVLVALPSPHM
jgi:putative copper export protein